MAAIPLLPGARLGWTTGINDAGLIVGNMGPESGSSSLNAFVSDNGAAPRRLFPDATVSRADKIDNHNRVLGNTGTTQYVDLFNLDGTLLHAQPLVKDPRGNVFSSYLGNPMDMNDNRQVVGYTHPLDDYAAIWEAPNASQRMTARGDAPFGFWDFSYAEAINNRGQVVGTYSDSTTNFAYLWQNETFRTLGPLAGYFRDVNDATQAVGINKGRAMFWSDPTGFVDLNGRIDPKLNWLLTEADAINAAGQIAGSGTVAGERHAYLLTPAAPGDANADGAVDSDDLLILAQNYGDPAADRTWWAGDFTGDGRVDFDDLLKLAQNYTAGTAAGNASLPASFDADLAAATAAVPEPAALAPALLAALTCGRAHAGFGATCPEPAEGSSDNLDRLPGAKQLYP